MKNKRSRKTVPSATKVMKSKKLRSKTTGVVVSRARSIIQWLLATSPIEEVLEKTVTEVVVVRAHR